jgi:putative addiction module component (TIGR02574 family)
MIALDELKKLPLEERIQIVDELTKSIEEDHDFQESPELIAELERRHANYLANPSSASSWPWLQQL